MDWISGLRARLDRIDERRRKVLFIVALLGLAIPGAAFLGLSLGQEVTHLEGSSLSGSVAAGRTTIPLGWPVHTYAELTWADPTCGVQFYFLTLAEFQAWQGGAPLGDPSLTCDTPAAAIPGPAEYAITVNNRGIDVNYTIQFDLFLARRPAAWLALPALFMIFAATIALVVRLLGAVLGREMDRLASEQEFKRR